MDTSNQLQQYEATRCIAVFIASIAMCKRGYCIASFVKGMKWLLYGLICKCMKGLLFHSFVKGWKVIVSFVRGWRDILSFVNGQWWNLVWIFYISLLIIFPSQILDIEHQISLIKSLLSFLLFLFTKNFCCYQVLKI